MFQWCGRFSVKNTCIIIRNPSTRRHPAQHCLRQSYVRNSIHYPDEKGGNGPTQTPTATTREHGPSRYSSGDELHVSESHTRQHTSSRCFTMRRPTCSSAGHGRRVFLVFCGSMKIESVDVVCTWDSSFTNSSYF